MVADRGNVDIKCETETNNKTKEVGKKEEKQGHVEDKEKTERRVFLSATWSQSVSER